MGGSTLKHTAAQAGGAAPVQAAHQGLVQPTSDAACSCCPAAAAPKRFPTALPSRARTCGLPLRRRAARCTARVLRTWVHTGGDKDCDCRPLARSGACGARAAGLKGLGQQGSAQRTALGAALNGGVHRVGWATAGRAACNKHTWSSWRRSCLRRSAMRRRCSCSSLSPCPPAPPRPPAGKSGMGGRGKGRQATTLHLLGAACSLMDPHAANHEQHGNVSQKPNGTHPAALLPSTHSRRHQARQCCP